jgi:hypothetical protein
MCSPELVQNRELHRVINRGAFSYSLWNDVPGKDGALDDISTCPAPAVVMTAATFDVFQRLLITNLNFLLFFWHIGLSSFLGCCLCCVIGYCAD